LTVPDTTEPETTTTDPDGLPEDTVEPAETTIPETTVPDDEVQIVPDETEQPTDTTQPQEYISETTLLKVENSSTTTLPELVTVIEQVPEALEEVIEDEPVTDEQSRTNPRNVKRSGTGTNRCQQSSQVLSRRHHLRPSHPDSVKPRSVWLPSPKPKPNNSLNKSK
jgi:hypothetical protein